MFPSTNIATSSFRLAVTFLALSSTLLTVQSAPVIKVRDQSALMKRVGGEMSNGDLYSMGIPDAPDSYWAAMAAAAVASSSSSVAPQATPATVPTQASAPQAQGVVAAAATPSSPTPSPSPTAMDRGGLYSIGIPPPPQGFYQGN